MATTEAIDETAPEMKVRAIAPWFGGKRTMAAGIVKELGPHQAYWELFAGSMAVLFAKPRSRCETVNDLHGDAITLVRVMSGPDWWELADMVQRTPFSEELFRESAERMRNDEPDEVRRAYDFLVTSWMGLNGIVGTARICPSFAAALVRANCRHLQVDRESGSRRKSRQLELAGV